MIDICIEVGDAFAHLRHALPASFCAGCPIGVQECVTAMVDLQ
jgi:Pyruvate/2-oxoacid:ferredoxin oxidoreductase delta subunit